jgi:hypothetical protein
LAFKKLFCILDAQAAMMTYAWGSFPRKKFRRGVLTEVVSLMCCNLTGRPGEMKQEDAVNTKPTVDTSSELDFLTRLELRTWVLANGACLDQVLTNKEDF